MDGVENKRLCPECHRPVKGRVDKRFCSAECRSSYHNRRRGIDEKYIRAINRILRRNRNILAQLNPSGKIKLPRARLAEKGFHFGYHTHIYRTKSGNVYLFCYDQGYIELPGAYVALVRREPVI